MPFAEDHLLGQFIPVHYHHHMLGDEARTSAFKAALQEVVPAGGRVLELGSGTAILSFFAAQRAASVSGVEYNPELVELSRTLLEKNGVADRVTIIQADAHEYCPTEPVDVVICEMLHSALLREKQLSVIDRFKKNYLQRFSTLPRFLPEATILGAQPLSHNYDYLGYRAAVPVFQDAATPSDRSIALAPARSYAVLDYAQDLSGRIAASLNFQISEECEVNAVRFITRNLLVIGQGGHPGIDWHNQHLVLPLNEPVRAPAGCNIEVTFSYQSGAGLDALAQDLRCRLTDSKRTA
jgi:predicted RNA methylase